MTNKRNVARASAIPKLGTTVRLASAPRLANTQVERSILRWSSSDPMNYQYRIDLYRFLADHLPVISSCLWTWVRLLAAPGKFVTSGSDNQATIDRGTARLEQLSDRLYANILGNRIGISNMLSDLLLTLLRDGSFGGFLLVNRDGSGVDEFMPVDPRRLVREQGNSGPRLLLESETGRLGLERPDFYFVPFGNAASEPFGRSILQPVPFVAFIEQQLVDDMRRTSHNSGYHRLHVKITPPERIAGESDGGYTDRMNEYFDATVKMIRSCDVDDNPVTWDNVDIEHIGPEKSRGITNSWFMSHRAMVEDICAGTNLSPYLLGYSYGSTTSWAEFKFDTVMRQVRSIQAEVATFLEWIGNIDLALGNLDLRCRWEFDNSFAYRAREESAVTSDKVTNLLKLFEAGLIEPDEARRKARGLL